MKLLLISPLPPPEGGIATWTKGFCTYMEREKHMEISLVNTSLIGKRSEKKARGFYPVDELKRNAAIIRQFKESGGREDLIYLCSSCTWTGLIRDYCMLKTGVHKPLVIHFHCNIVDQVGHSRIGRRILRYMISKARQLIVLNHASYAYLLQMGAENITLISNFIDGDWDSEPYTVRETMERVLYVGHVRERKGMKELVKAAEAFPTVQFDCIGPVSDDMADVLLPPNVHFLGKRSAEEVKTELSRADLFVLPSYSEGFSLAVLEAMASGLPVVASDAGANADMIEDRGGIIVPPMDAQALEAAIRTMEDPAKRAACSAFNREKVRTCYTAERVLEQLFGVLECVE